MQSITIPAGTSHAVDDSFRLGILRVAILAAARFAELEADRPDSYDTATRGLRRALASLAATPSQHSHPQKGSKGGSAATPMSLPPEIESLRVEVLGAMDKTSAEAVAARRPLVSKASSSSSRAVPAKEFNPRCVYGSSTPINSYHVIKWSGDMGWLSPRSAHAYLRPVAHPPHFNWT